MNLGLWQYVIKKYFPIYETINHNQYRKDVFLVATNNNCIFAY